jgi:hypothetical protein
MPKSSSLICAALIAAAAMTAAAPARAEAPEDAIRAVVLSQLRAFQADDLGAAFAHASPDIQSKFGTPETFGRMVATGYPMIWRPARYEMLGLRQTPAGPVQMVLFEDARGQLFEAAYEMERIGGAWRIDGVYLRHLPGAGS